MWEFMSTKHIYRRTYKWASQPAGIEGIEDVFDGYDALERLSFCNTVKYI